VTTYVFWLLLQTNTYESQLSIFYSCQTLYSLNHRNHNKNILKFAAFQYVQKYLQVFQGTAAQCVAQLLLPAASQIKLSIAK